ncbi:MAG: AtpZ/AtpI family protein [Halanaerobiales bacterium]|nr:AtpZ/AtpI family protein [Halanaerobiales bacterium]
MKKNDWQDILRAIGLLTQLGLIMVSNIGVGFYLGHVIDQLTTSGLFFKLAGLLLGIAAGFYSNYLLIKKMTSKKKQDDQLKK